MRVINEVNKPTSVIVLCDGHRVTLLAETEEPGSRIEIQGDVNHVEEMLERWTKLLKDKKA